MDFPMATVVEAGSWRELWASGLFGRFVLLCLGIWLHAADTLVMATIVPAVIDDVGGISYVGWTISLYQIGAIVAGASTAAGCQRFGLRRVLLTAAMLYGAGCVIAGVAPHMAVLLCVRLVQGIGGGMLISLSYVAVQQLFAERFWSRLFGIVAVIWGAGSLLGPLIGGVFASLNAWRGAFWFFAILAAVLWATAWVLLPAGSTKAAVRAPPPFVPVLILSAATLIIAEAGVAGGGIPSVVLCFTGLGLLYLAARLDQQSSERLLPGQTLDAHHPVGAGLLMVFALSLATTGFWAYGPLLLKIMFDTAPLASGYILAGEALSWSAGTIAVSNAPASATTLLIRLGVILVASGAGAFAVVVPFGSFAGIVLCCLSQGFGFGLCWPFIVQRVVRFADDGERTLAAAAPGTVQRIGYAVGSAATGIAGNLSGLSDGVSLEAARTASFWVFASFIPVLLLGLLEVRQFTRNAET